MTTAWHRCFLPLAVCLGFSAGAAGDPALSLVLQKPVKPVALDTIVIESQRDPEDRRKRVKPPAQRFREALAASPRRSGVAQLDDGKPLPPGFQRYTPHGAVTAFRAGSEGPGY